MSRQSDKIDDAGSGGPTPRAQRIIMFALAVVGSIGSFFLSWPYWRDFGYWATTPTMWNIYFAVGFVLAIYVFYTFLRSLRTLFEHDALEHIELAAVPEPERKGDRP